MKRNFVCGLLCLPALLILAGPGWTEDRAQPAFTLKPTAATTNGKTTIAFSVNRETDVAVFVEDAHGRVIRHLVAGVLGKNAPPPLKPGLEQKLSWDGRADYGVPAKDGPFKVRVALGLSAKYDKVLLRDPQTLFGIKGLAVGPDGTLYVAETVGGAVWTNTILLAFGRNGKYRRTVYPFASNLKPGDVEDLKTLTLQGRPAPLITSHRLGLGHLPAFVRRTPMGISPDGKALAWVSTITIGALDHHGGSGFGNPDPGPFLTLKQRPEMVKPRYTAWPALAFASDGKSVFVAGFRPNKYKKKVDYACVLRVPFPDRTKAERFFGDWLKTGKSPTLLGGAPHGLASDGKGSLYIADHNNNRVVVVSEESGTMLGELQVNRPHYLAVHPGNGNLYVTSWTGEKKQELLKFSDWKEGKVLGRATLRWDGNKYYPPLLALDPNEGGEPLVWVASSKTGLKRYVDLGDQFKMEQISTQTDGAACFLDVTVDRWRKDREIYTRCGVYHDWWYRYNEDTEKVDRVVTPGKYVGGIGMGLRAGPCGFLYGLWYPYKFYKHDRKGNRVAWEKPMPPPPGATRKGRPLKLDKYTSYVPNSECALTHGLGIRHDGHLFTLEPGRPGGRPPKMMHEYHPSGERLSKDPILWKTSDAALGPYFDAQGNIYIAEYVRNKDWYYPEKFNEVFGPAKAPLSGAQAETARMYGSVVKFSPRGGMVHVSKDFKAGGGYDPFKGTPNLEGLTSMDLEYYHGGQLHSIKVTGAQWIHQGLSHCGIQKCTCENVTMDVDEFGRVWFPDTNLFQIRVIDTNGNRITEFGSYGNAESCGPDSPVIDPVSGKVRPRRDGEKLKSPFAHPQIAFAWLVGVAVTDRHIYTGDSVNRRMLKLKIEYAAESSCPIK